MNTWKIIVGLITLLLVQGVYAGDINVPGDYATIQAAITAASDGDKVIVADGTYRGDGNRDIDFMGKAITVESENGPSNCIIDCQGSSGSQRRGFIFDKGEGRDSVLDGFTITNGYGDLKDVDGGWEYNTGGAIFCETSSPTIRRCNLIKNTNDMSYDPVTVGGAITCCYGADALIENCIISENKACAAGGVLVFRSSTIIRNCIISNNVSDDVGGILINESSNVEISNCTIVNNTDYHCDIGGIEALCSSQTITNCIFWGNDINDLVGTNGEATATYSCIEDIDSEPTNIHSDPYFVDADNNDFHLRVYSPCIDAGDPNGNYDGQFDIDGQTRVICSRVDIGADETIFCQNECFPVTYTTYTDWVEVGKPNCWCGQYGDPNWNWQCYGDADNKYEGVLNKYRVYTSDYTILMASWGLKYTQMVNNPDPNVTICADFDHKYEGPTNKYRVYQSDYTIMLAHWAKKATQLQPWCPLE